MRLRGPITLATVAALAAAGAAGAVSFSWADRDRDGFVTYEEAERTMPRLSEIHFGKCDGDRDGLLDKGEFACLDALYSTMYMRRD
jgi:hypothetical protein